MKLTERRGWVVAASLSAVAVVASVASASAGAAGGGKTYVLKTTAQRGSVWIAGGGKAMRPGRLSAGNRLFETDAVRRDDGVTGVFVATVVVASPGTVAAKTAASPAMKDGAPYTCFNVI